MVDGKFKCEWHLFLFWCGSVVYIYVCVYVSEMWSENGVKCKKYSKAF